MQNQIKLESVSEKFLSLRLKHNLRQVDLGKLTGLNQETISNIERGKNYTIENFLVLFNFYSNQLNSRELLLRTLFNIKFQNELLLNELQKLKNTQNKELDTIIKLLE